MPDSRNEKIEGHNTGLAKHFLSLTHIMMRATVHKPQWVVLYRLVATAFTLATKMRNRNRKENS